MYRHPLQAELGSSTLARLVLDDDPREVRLRELARALPALDLRLARVLVWLRGRDLAPLGYPGWLAFIAERVEWGESWVRDLTRLVRSSLTAVLRAACEGRISLAVAARAPGWCDPERQGAWIARAEAGTLGERPKQRPRGASATVEPGEADATVIWNARKRAELLVGLPLSDREADEHILGWWRERRADLVERALAPAPPPLPCDMDLDWPFEDPATPLMGPWRTPSDLGDAVVMLEAIHVARRERVRELGRLYDDVVGRGLHRAWGYRDVEHFCERVMGLSARTLQRYRELGRVLRRHPALDRKDLSLAKVEAIARVVADTTAERWLAIAPRVGVVELRAAVSHVETGADPEIVLGAYETAIAGATTSTVAVDALKAPAPPPLTDRVHPSLPEAARWLLREVPIPRQRGVGRAKERDRFVCGNPECRRRALRNQAHHVVPRSRGGADDLQNIVCVCVSCHLRLIHAGHVSVERRGEALVWTFPGRSTTVVPGPAVLGRWTGARAVS